MDPNDLDEPYLTTRRDTRLWQQRQVGLVLTPVQGEGTRESPKTQLGVEAQPGQSQPKREGLPPLEEERIEEQPIASPPGTIGPLPTPEEAEAERKIREETQPTKEGVPLLEGLQLPQELLLGALAGKPASRVPYDQFVEDNFPGGAEAFLEKMKQSTGGDVLGPLLMTLPTVAVGVLVDPLNAIAGVAPVTKGLKLTKAQQTAFETAHATIKELYAKTFGKGVQDIVGSVMKRLAEEALDPKRGGISVKERAHMKGFTKTLDEEIQRQVDITKETFGSVVSQNPFDPIERIKHWWGTEGGQSGLSELELAAMVKWIDFSTDTFRRALLSGKRAELLEWANDILNKARTGERGSIQVAPSSKGQTRAAKAAEAAATTKTPTWQEAIKIDESQRAFEERRIEFSERISTQRRGVVSDVDLLAESRSPDAITVEAFLNLQPGTLVKASDVVTIKRMFRDLAEPVRLLSQWVAAHPQDNDAFLALLEQLPKVEEGLIRLAGVYAEPPRIVRALSPVRPSEAMIPAESAERIRISDPYIQQWLAFFQQQDELAKIGAPAMTKDKMVQALAAMQTDDELISAAKALARPTWWDMFIEYWINGLLSGPQTHATNLLSNAATLAWGIPERAVAAMFSRSVRPNEATAMISGITESMGDAWRMAWQAFKKGESQLGLGKLEGPRRAITADALELTGVAGRAVDYLGSVIRLPGRFLLAGDDFFKAIAFRAELRTLAKRESFKQVTEAGLSGKAATARMAEIEQRILADPPESIKTAAQEFAAYVTFTRELGETGQKIQMALSTPIGRIVVPFVRTPTNIFKYAGERTPFAFASEAIRAEIAAGGERRALALAKISLGSMTMAYLGSLAAEGIITGGGPKDKRLRQELMATGWQPYSFKIGNTYYRYSRIEPLGSLIGLAADAADLLGQLPEQDANELAASLVVALARNVSQKTFVQGLAGTLNAVASQDINVVASFFEKELPTLLPASTLLAQTTRQVDPVLREVNSIMDAFKARTPGYSDDLPPRRNLWGDPIVMQGGLGPDMISPIYTSQVKLDPVSSELVRLELPISMPSRQINGVPLTPQEYDAYVVLQGAKPILGEMTLKERLTNLMQSDLYKRSSDGPDGGKAVLIRQWINTYRDMARHILSSKELSQQHVGTSFPELYEQIDMKRKEQAQQFNAPQIGIAP